MRTAALGTIGVFFGVAGLYHLSAILLPSLGDHGSVLRHSVFVAIDGAVAVGLFFRPRFFFWFFTALGLQQLHSHGSAFVHEWSIAHRLDWPSLLVLAIIPITWSLLWFEYRQRPGAEAR